MLMITADFYERDYILYHDAYVISCYLVYNAEEDPIGSKRVHCHCSTYPEVIKPCKRKFPCVLATLLIHSKPWFIQIFFFLAMDIDHWFSTSGTRTTGGT